MNSKLKIKKNNIVTIVTILLMIFSLLTPYNKYLSIIYQITVAAFIVLYCKSTSYALMPILVLSTTRTYISISTSDQIVNYYGLNGTILTLILIALLLFKLKENDFKLKIYRGSESLILFSILMLISSVWAINTYEYTDYYKSICIIYLLVPFLIESEDDIKFSKFMYIISGLFLGITIVPHILLKGTIYESSVVVDRNYQSCFVILCLLQNIIYLTDYKKEIRLMNKLIYISVILMDLYLIITSASRSAIISLVIAVLVFLLINHKDLKKIFVFFIVLSIILFYAYDLHLLDFILERFELDNVVDGNGRTLIWDLYLKGFSKGNLLNLIFGHGLVGQTFYGKPAHNIFISILYSYGLLGIILFTKFILNIIFNLVSSKRFNEFILMIPIFFMCCTVEPYYRVEFALYLPLILGISNYYRRNCNG